MSIKPIPQSLLIHEAVYEEFLNNERWGETFAAPVALYNVRVQPAKGLIKDTIREAISARAVLFFDTTHSIPAMQDFVIKSKVTFNNEVYTIQDVQTFYAFADSPHHYELILV
jgi:hypothetical protein